MTYKNTYAYKRVRNLVTYIKEHGIEASIIIKKDATYKIKALEKYSKEGKDYEKYIYLNPNYNEVREWLGY